MKNVIPEDCEYSQLQEIAETEQLAQTLQQHIWPAATTVNFCVRDCRLKRVYYKRGKFCRVLLEVRMQNGSEQDAGRQLFLGELHEDSKQRLFSDVSNSNILVQPEFGKPLTYIPSLKLSLLAFPNDPTLDAVPFMGRTDAILELARAHPESVGLAKPPERVTAILKKYVPHKRCGYVYRFESTKESEQSSFFEVYGKAYLKDEGERAYRIAQLIWESEARRKGELLLPQPYSYDSSRGVLWQQALAGSALAKNVKNRKNLPEAASEIGRRLAALHGSKIELPPRITLDHQVGTLQKSLAAITQDLAEYANPCKKICDRLFTAAKTLGPGPLVPIHASFKCSHIFETEQGIAFIDFDGANLGDPGFDLGRFIAHIYRIEAGCKITSEIARNTIKNFLNSYLSSCSIPISTERIDWFTASHLVGSEMYRAVKRMNEDLARSLLGTLSRVCPC